MTDFGDMVTHMSGVPVDGEFTTGDVYFVDSATGSASNAGTNNSPLNTLANGIAAMTANKGDILYIKPGHTETTTAVAVNKAGITIKGIGRGRVRPTFTATTGASDLFDITAANVAIENIRMVGAASGCTSLISIAANDFMCRGCSLEQAATPLIGVIVQGGYDRFAFSDCTFMGTAAGPDVAVDLQGSGNSVDWVIERCDFNYQSSAGLDLAGVRSAKTDTGVRVTDCRFIGMDAVAISFASSSTGLLERISVLSNNATVAEMIDAGLCGFVDCRVADGAKSGALIPATTSTP